MGGLFFARMPTNRVGVLDPAIGTIREFQVPPDDSVPHGMTTGSGGEIWITLFFQDKIARLRLHPGGTLAIDEYVVPSKRSQPHDLAVDASRNVVWFTTHRGNSIGRLDLGKAEPGTPKGMHEVPVPCERCNPHSIVLDSEGNVWFTEMGLFFRKQFTNKIGRLTP